MNTAALDRQLSDIVYMLIKALRSGYSVRESLEALAETAPEPAASALKGWLADLESGCTYDEAFVNLQAVWPSPYLAQIVATIVATVPRSQGSGGNLATQLEPLAEQIYQAVGTDQAFYPEMRRQAERLGGPLPDRVQKE